MVDLGIASNINIRLNTRFAPSVQLHNIPARFRACSPPCHPVSIYEKAAVAQSASLPPSGFAAFAAFERCLEVDGGDNDGGGGDGGDDDD